MAFGSRSIDRGLFRSVFFRCYNAESVKGIPGMKQVRCCKCSGSLIRKEKVVPEVDSLMHNMAVAFLAMKERPRKKMHQLVVNYHAPQKRCEERER